MSSPTETILPLRTALIFYNPISSAGSSTEVARRLRDHLIKAGIAVQLFESKKSVQGYQRRATEIAANDVVIVVGGDGTVRSLLTTLGQTETLLYAVPGGNESLFARSYGMSCDPDALLSAMTSGRSLKQYYGVIQSDFIAQEKPFFIMASMGLDSLTVKRIGERTGPLNDLIYLWHGLAALALLHHPTVSITVDGERVVDHEEGYVIVANSPAYAKNLALVPHANPSNNALDVGFLPGAGRRHELTKALRIVQHRPADLPLRFFAGQHITLTLHQPAFPLQVDGDYCHQRDVEPGAVVKFSVSPKPVRLLVPSRLSGR